MLRLFDFIATGFYSGYSPKAPGTVGTAAIMALMCVLVQVFPGLSFSSNAYLVAVLLVCVVGTAVCEALLRSNYYGVDLKDPQRIVIDEFAGYLVATAFAPTSITTLALAFIFFRLFDITKIFPIRKFEKLPGGLGIMADDIIAGCFACVCVHLALKIIG